ncbi:MAG: putative sigma-54 modulation protein [Chloroflexota bacterium]|nr:putative sigma-54 modulation protein [Chloroflexota bacterium]
MNDQVDIFVKNMDLTDDLKDYIDKKIPRLERYLDQIDETRIDLSYVKTTREADCRFVAQITLRGRGFILRAEERAVEIKPAIDLVMDKIERQIERYKGKKFKNRVATPSVEDYIMSEEEEVEEAQPLIARRKTFTLAPMDEMEAIEQMNLLGHEDFFIFYNAHTSSINVLYKRRDGSYGIIQPKLG